MSDTKRRFERFSFYDHTGMERHLEKMAAQGWMVKKVGFLWRYRKTEPRQVKFTVTFYPRASMFDPEPTEGELDFRAFCERTGWKLAASNAQLQIFYNEDLNAAPLYTDPVTEVETLHRTAKRAFLPSFYVLLALVLLQFYMFISDLVTRPLYLLSSTLRLCTVLMFIVLTFLLIAELAGYYSWRRRARRAAQRGEFLRTRSHIRLQTGCMAAAALILLLYLVSLALEADSLYLFLFALMAVLMAGTAALTVAIRALLKRLRVPRNVNRVLTFGVPFVVGTVVTSAVVFLVVGAVSGGRIAIGKDARTETYEYRGQVWHLYRDELPLVIDDLLDTDAGDYIRERTGSESVLLGRFECNQHPRWDTPDRAELPQLEYEIVSVKMSFLYGRCRQAKLKEYNGDGWYVWVPVDPAPWGAKEAWVWTDKETGEARDRYLLCGERRIVEISFSWTPDSEQMRTAGERLLGT